MSAHRTFLRAFRRYQDDPSDDQLAALADPLDALLDVGVPDELADRVASVAAKVDSIISPTDLAAVRVSAERLTRALRLPAVGRDVRATLLAAQSVDLSALGRHNEALETIEEAVALRRRLADEHDANRNLRDTADEVPDTLEREHRKQLGYLADALNDLCLRRFDLGRNDVLEPIEEAVTIRRRLAAVEGGPTRALAQALTNAGIIRSSRGLDQAALAASEEAVTIRRQLCVNDDSELPGLANALNGLGSDLFDLGRFQEGLAALAEATDLYRDLSETDETHRPSLAKVLNNLGVVLSDLGAAELALEVTTEALAIYEDLTETDDAYRSDVALAANNLSVRLSRLGRHHEALPPTQRAVDIYRTLATTNRANQSDLAMALGNLGLRLSNLARPRDALQPIEEAVTLYRGLAKTNEVHGAALARSLHNLSIVLAELGRHGDALPPVAEAVAIRRRLADANAAHRIDVASSLDNLSTVLAELGRHHDALTTAHEAVALTRELSAENEADLPDHAKTLNTLALRLSGVGRPTEALGTIENAVDLYRELAATNEAYRSELARSLNNLSNLLAELNRHHDALAPVEEAIAIDRELAALNEFHQSDLARALTTHSIRLAEVDRHDEALTEAEESVVIRRRLADANGAFLADLANSLNVLGGQLSRLDRHEEAIGPVAETVDVFRRLATENDAFESDLAMALNNLSIRSYNLGRAEAEAAMDEAVERYRQLASANQAHTADLANSLNNLGTMLVSWGRPTQASQVWVESAGLDSGVTTTARCLRALLEEDPSHWPTGTAATVTAGLERLTDQIGVQRFTMGHRSDRRLFQGRTARLGSLATTFLARDCADPRAALRWADTTGALELQLTADLRDDRTVELRAKHTELAERLDLAVGGAAGSDLGPTEPPQHRARRELPSEVLELIRRRRGYESFLAPRSVDDIVAARIGVTEVVIACGWGGGVALVVDDSGVTSVEHGLSLEELIAGLNQVLATEDDDDSRALLARLQLTGLIRTHLLAHLSALVERSPTPVAVVPVGLVSWLPIQAVASSEGLSLGIHPTIGWRPSPQPAAMRPPFVIHSEGPSQPTTSTDPGQGGVSEEDRSAALAEARAVADLLGVDCVTDPYSSPERARSGLVGSSYAHFSCHGTADLADPDRSGLLLGPNVFSLSQINQTLETAGPPSFVGLSACQTARTDTEAPEQALSLATIFLAHGTSAGLATHWNVSAPLARDFCLELNRRWVEGVTVGEAYDETLRSLLISVQRAGHTDALDSLFAFTIYGDRNLRWPGPRSR